jgi:hypothetical protein
MIQDSNSQDQIMNGWFHLGHLMDPF